MENGGCGEGGEDSVASRGEGSDRFELAEYREVFASDFAVATCQSESGTLLCD